MGSQQVGGGKMRLLFALLSIIVAAASALPARTLGFGGTTWTSQGTGKTSRTITSYGFFEPNSNNGEFYTKTYDGALGLDGWSTPAPATNNNNPGNNNNNPGSGVIAARQPQYVQTDKSA